MKKILLLLLLCCSGVSLFSQSQNAYLSKMSDTLLKQSLNRNIENSYSYWDTSEDTLSGIDVISDYYDRKLYDSAEMSIRNVSKISFDKKFFPFSMCIVKMAKQQYDSAFYFANQTLLLDPFNQGALHNKAYIYWRSQRYDQAEQIFNELINLHSEDLDNYFMKAEVLLASGKFKEAIAFLKTVESMELTPGQALITTQMLVNAYLPALYLKLDCVKMIEQPFENAMAYVEKGVALDSTQVYNYYLRTRINYTLETDAGYQLVIDDYNRIASLDSNLQLTCDFAIANCLLYLHKPKEAVDLLNESLDDIGEELLSTLNLDDLSLVAIIREMRDLPIYQHEENEVYFQLLSGVLSTRFSQRKLSRIFKKVNKKMPPSLLTTRFNIYFAKQSTFKLHTEEYGDYLTWCELSVIFEESGVADAFDNVDLMWNYALSLDHCEDKPEDVDEIISSAYEQVVAYLPKNSALWWDYITYKIDNDKSDEAIALIRHGLDENKNPNFHLLAARAYIKLEEKDSANYYVDAILANDTIELVYKKYYLEQKVAFAYEIRDFEMLEEALFVANQLDPLTPYYYSREAILKFLKEPDADEISRLIRLMKRCDMPQNDVYCNDFEGVLMLLSGQLLTAKKRSIDFVAFLENVNIALQVSPFDHNYYRKVENIKNLMYALNIDQDQNIDIFYLYFGVIEAAFSIPEKNYQLRTLFPDPQRIPGWIQAYNIYWSPKSVSDATSQVELQRCLRREPNNVVALTFSAYFYLKSGEYQSALDAAEIAEKCSPYCANAIWFKAVALYELGQLEASRETVVKYNRICRKYGMTSRQKFIKMGKKMLKEFELSVKY